MEDFNVQQILEMLEQGYRYSDIVKETGLSYGQIRYRLRKHENFQKQQFDDSLMTETNIQEKSFQIASEQIQDESWTRNRSKSGIFAMVKDPETVFTYWFVNDDRRSWVEQFFHCSWKDMPVYLRIYDTTAIYFNGYNAHKMFEIQVHHHTDSWYIHNLEHGRSYVIDFGIHTLQNEFLTLLRSNCVTTPQVQLNRNNHLSLRLQTVHNTCV